MESRVLLATDVVVNEIHYDPDIKTEPVEFVELHNAGDESADLSEWSFADGIDYTFAPGTVLAPGGYLVISQDPAAVQAKFNVDSLGPFGGKLSNTGERLLLVDLDGQPQDEVTYRRGFPWPTVGGAAGNSIELVHARFDNDLGGSWRSSISGPTPGAQNSRFTENIPPQLRQVEHLPNVPRSGQDVTITVKATDVDGVTSVHLDYQVVAPGDYVSIDDARYAVEWTTIEMRDDGRDGDDQANNDIYTVTLPAAMQQHRHLVRYRITAVDAGGASITGPYDDDPTPNFAYYVYDGVSDWQASVQPGVDPAVTYGSDVLESVQVYQLITTRQAHADAQQLPDANVPEYHGRDYLWHGALVFDGTVYDHIRFRPRGGENRFLRGKNSWKFDFNRGHELQARDNYGKKYDTSWDKLNLSHIIQQERGFRGDHGLSEAVSFRLFNLAGAEGPNTHFVHFRIVENADENQVDQYATDFQGLYLAVEQPDGRMLDEHGLPDGNLYKIELGLDIPGTLNNQGPTQPSDSADLIQFADTYSDRRNPPSELWWRENFDLQRYFSYRTILEAVRHYDIVATNQFYYHNPATDKWSVHPWDLDLTWRTNVFGSGVDAFAHRLARHDELAREYHNRIREVLDLLFNHDQTDMLIEETARFLHTPNQLSFTDAERAMWDYNPILANAPAGVAGQFYEDSPSGDFAGMIGEFKDFIDERTAYLYDRIVKNEDLIPHTPIITYAGDPTFPLNRLTFQTSPYSSQTEATFGAMQWRIAEVTDTSRADFDPSQPRKYEIDATWESDELTQFSDTVTIPADDLQQGHTYRARVRMRDTEGNWSHWSEAVQLVPGPGQGSVVESLRVTEINYHPHDPPDGSPFDDNDFEFIEFQNVGTETIDLAGVSFQDGVEFTFIGDSSEILDVAFDTDAAGFVYVDDALNDTQNPDHEDGNHDLNVGNQGGGLQVFLGPGTDAGPLTFLQTSFDAGPDGFSYVPDAFNQTSNPDAVTGNVADGRLEVFIGPGDTQGPASGAWQTSFNLPEANTVGVELVFGMTNGPGFESTEFGEVLLQIDGVFYGRDFNNSLAHLAGKAVTTTGPISTNLSVPLEAGDHTITLGAFNNQASDNDESVLVWFDDVSLTLPEPGAIGETSGGWSRAFNLPVPGTLEVAVDHRTLLGAGFEPSEFAEIVLTIDDVRYGSDTNGSLSHFTGGQIEDSGWVQTQVSVPLLEAGQHTITLGAYSKGASAADEFVEVRFDNVQVTLFRQVLLEPGETTLVVSNQAAFESRYGADRPITGELVSRKFSNAGERIILKTTANETIQEFTYDDGGQWPPEADGRGATLEVIDTSGDYNDPHNWRASRRPGGSPGSRQTIGDFNSDGQLDCSDIDGLVAEIVSGNQDVRFDLTDDGILSPDDIDAWLATAGAANLPSGRAYLAGDANLDGRVNAQDLNQVGQHWQTSIASWCGGDFSADGVVNAADLNTLGQNWQLDVTVDEIPAAAQNVTPSRTPRAPLAKQGAIFEVDAAYQIAGVATIRGLVETPRAVGVVAGSMGRGTGGANQDVTLPYARAEPRWADQGSEYVPSTSSLVKLPRPVRRIPRGRISGAAEVGVRSEMDNLESLDPTSVDAVFERLHRAL